MIIQAVSEDAMQFVIELELDHDMTITELIGTYREAKRLKLVK
jgi:hypothetical protein